ncbi:unnamed protein product [Cylicostephanus goldi]|uniref:Nonsense-mediated mRNA decay factor SMG8 n=1 Tax=Cylicostephanus goldi TaxID=71465 RepID=A0A3P6SJH7_CYLGO|nr:unnamed protein product [Cylicostephanus goldi]
MTTKASGDPCLRALRLEEWLEQAESFLAPYLEKKVIVVALVGKDSVNRGKGEDLNDFLRMDVFPRWTTEESTMSIEAFYCVDTNVVYLLVNGYADFTNLRQVLTPNPEKNFFERMAESEEEEVRLLHFISIFSHMIIFVESSTRFDISLADMLASVNKLRWTKNVREDISEIIEETSKESAEWIKEGRVACPRIVFAFQRNIIRTELGYVKKVWQSLLFAVFCLLFSFL